MTMLGTLRAPFSALACADCTERLHISQPVAYRPQVMYEHSDSPPVAGPSIRLDVGRLAWRRTDAGRYSLEAVASATCPSCLRPEELRSLVSSCRGVVVNGLTCPVHGLDMDLDGFDLSLGNATDGVTSLEIRASAQCPRCAERAAIRCEARAAAPSLADDTVARLSFAAGTVAVSSLTPDVVLLVATDDDMRAVLSAFGVLPGSGAAVADLGRAGGASVVCVRAGYPVRRLRPGAVVALTAGRSPGVVVATHVLLDGVRVPVTAALLARLTAAAAGWSGGRVSVGDVLSASPAALVPAPWAVIAAEAGESARFLRYALELGGWAVPVPAEPLDGRIVAAGDGRDLGAGFRLGGRLIVTAAHVVRGRDAGTVAFVAPGAGPDVIEWIEREDETDVAVLRVGGSALAELAEAEFAETELAEAEPGVVEPRLVDAEPDDRWRVLGRPRSNDPQLTGVVTAVDHVIRNAGGAEVRVLQLQVSEAMADFGGYSGSAVTVGGAVVGVLVEQVHERHRDGARARRATNVLYAVPISFVVRRFGLRLPVAPAGSGSPDRTDAESPA